MERIGKRVTVTVAGFGSKAGVVDRYDFDHYRFTPYHVTFDDGAAGWFDAEQCGFVRWVSASEAPRAIVHTPIGVHDTASRDVAVVWRKQPPLFTFIDPNERLESWTSTGWNGDVFR